MGNQPKIKVEVSLSGLVHVQGKDTHTFNSTIKLDLDEGVQDGEIEDMIGKVLLQTMSKGLWRGGAR